MVSYLRQSIFIKCISFLRFVGQMQPCQSVEKTRVIEDCCHGFARTPDNSSCVPICAEQCLHGTCVGPDKCECEPGYGGATCMIGNLFICCFFLFIVRRLHAKLQLFICPVRSGTACPENKWGPNCRNSCPCQHGAKCDPLDGLCSCSRGWHGKHCDLPCKKGTYGMNCQQKCQCRNKAVCDHISGACTCPPGWNGPL